MGGGEQWAKLENSGGSVAVPQPNNCSNTEMQRPVYPTSKIVSRKPTDWDKLEQELIAEEKDEKLEGE